MIGCVSASSQSLPFILSLRLYSSFITWGPGLNYIVFNLPLLATQLPKMLGLVGSIRNENNDIRGTFFYVRRKVDLMKTAKVNAYIMHIFGKIELLSTHAT